MKHAPAAHRAVFVFLCAVVARTTLAADASSRINPLSKTIELLDSLVAKVTAEGEAEMKAYKEYVEWCDDASTALRFDIKSGEAKAEKLKAKIEKAGADISTSASKIEELAASIAEDEAELKSASAVRSKEVDSFKASEAELADVIETLGRAIAILDREMQKNPAALAQVDATNLDSLLAGLAAVVSAAGLNGKDQQKLTAFVQSRQTPEEDAEEDDAEAKAFGAPAAAVYKTHSTSILDVLEDLKDKAEAELSELRKAEANTKHNYEMLKQSLEDQIAADTKNMDEEKADKAATEEAEAAAEGELKSTEADLANDKKALEATTNSCMQVAADHDATVKSRAEELNALTTAKAILSNTTSGAVDQSYSFLQLGQGSKVGSRLSSRADLANAEVVSMVKRLAKQYHSAALAQLASRVAVVLKFGAAAGEDPFAKVKTLITDLISKLEAEASAEATEKAYCDDELAKTEAKKAELEGDLEKLSTKIEVAAAKSTELKADVKELQAELAELAKLQAEMDKTRTEGHAAYVQAKADLELGIQGVQQALVVLREYYQGGSSALLQGSVSAAMAQPAKPELHEPAVGAGGSIINILEVVEADFSKDLATEEAEEADAQEEYDKMTQENKVTKTMKDQDVKYKTQEHTTLDKSVAAMSSDRDTMSTELAAVLEYYGKIRERCIAKPETYEARKQRREAEIAGLKEALTILESETAFVQRKKHGHRAGAFLGL